MPRTDAQRARAAELARKRRAALKASGHQGEEYLRDREKRNEWAKNHRAENPEQYRAARARHRDKPGSLERIMLSQSRGRASKMGLEHTIELLDIEIPRVCPYLEIELVRNNRQGPTDTSPTLDRIDNNLGYIKGNVQVISYKANRMKNNATTEELLVFAESVIRIHRVLDPRDVD